MGVGCFCAQSTAKVCSEFLRLQPENGKRYMYNSARTMTYVET